ncbi:hypothetical protein [Bradyrhizobium sp. CCBAU 51753]|uniref:hypothetical protein n=1 Tax=Bradyrhizobium sp. CCBAU 51753 TaxID=1325100 RepID=UPI00188A4FD5|nr:hypothetical protein [Bradyrhizobium sp. CCBAU 51753]QOZ29135.1 hypothetical protein XH93_40490 [Bradyrhizobium sp. CCBAU 51753]
MQNIHPTPEPHLTRVGLDDRLVVLARTLHAPEPAMEVALRENAMNWARLGKTCLGQALYRHRSFFQNPSGSLVWSHVELSYFRGLVPWDVTKDLVVNRQPTDANLLRAEILLTTPSSFLLPLDWQGLADRSKRLASLEFIRVEPAFFGEYRNVMRDYCGPAAEKLLRTGKFGTFRAMETAAVLYHDPALTIDWNQIHLCELTPEGFQGFGPEFKAALRDEPSSPADNSNVFADLDRIRTVPYWTFNDPVVEADTAIAQEGRRIP